jgi:hypothetical protein
MIDEPPESKVNGTDGHREWLGANIRKNNNFEYVNFQVL